MRKSVAALFLVASVVGAPGQGTMILDDSSSIYGLAVDAPGNWYSGTFGMEVWELNGTAIPPGINLGPGPGSGPLGYDAMVAAGFVREATYVSWGTTSPGSFYMDELFMWHVNPPGSTVVVALAAWNTSAPSWSAMLAQATPDTRAGIVALVQPTADPTIIGAPPPVPALALNQDLVMTEIPEPSGLTLAGLGGALMLLARRSRQPRKSENRVD